MIRGRIATGALALSLATLLFVSWCGPSAAVPDLGPRGWLPGSLPISLTPWVVTWMLWGAYLVGGWGLWAAVTSSGVFGTTRMRALALAVLAAGTLLGAPTGTADHTNYAAYGQIAARGGDPWAMDPSTFAGGADPVTSAIAPPWQHTANVYGPVATAVMTASAWAGADSMRAIVWWWQLAMVACWLVARLLLIYLSGGKGRTVDTWFTFNPLVFGPAVLGAHVDLLALVLLVATLAWAVARWRAQALGWGSVLIGGVLAGLAGATKLTYLIVAVVVGVGLLVRAADRGPLSPGGPGARGGRWPILAMGQSAAGLVTAGGVTMGLSLLASPMAFSQARTSSSMISLASIWRPVAAALERATGRGAALALVSVAAIILCLVVTVALWRGQARRQVGIAALLATALVSLVGAYVLTGTYVLPWYLLPVWAGAAIVGGSGSRINAAVIGWGTALALCYVPGLVTLPAQLEQVTLGVRMVLGPLAGWALVAFVLVGSWRSRPAALART